MSDPVETFGPAKLVGISGRTCSVTASLRFTDSREGRGTLAFKEIGEGSHYMAATNDLHFKNGTRAKIIVEALNGMSGQFITTGPIDWGSGIPA